MLPYQVRSLVFRQARGQFYIKIGNCEDAACRADALSDLLGNAPKAIDAMSKDATCESGGVSPEAT